MSLAPLAVVGSINLDIIAAAPRLPGPGETVGDGVLRRRPGGKGANQAAAAARLGAPTRMIGAVGRDAEGDAMLDALRVAGVDVSGVGRVGEPTGTALIAVDADGENQIVVCPGANAHVSLEDVSFSDDEAVLVQLEIEMDVVTELARRVPGFLALNAAPARPLPSELRERVDLFIVNESEYALIPELADAPLVVVTYGGDGAALLERGREAARVPAVRVEPVDTVGAGDAFCAALTVGIRSGLAHEEALRAACAVGAFAVTQPESQPAFEPLNAYRG